MAESEPLANSHPLKHVAIIMDGNNRWAKQRGLGGVAGHEAGVERIRDSLHAAKSLGIDTITLFAFSSENWKRPDLEVRGLMSLFSSYLKKEAWGCRAPLECGVLLDDHERGGACGTVYRDGVQVHRRPPEQQRAATHRRVGR